MDEFPDGLPGPGAADSAAAADHRNDSLEPDATALEIPWSFSPGSRFASGAAGEEAQEEDLEGRVVGHFRILGPLGRGAMGVVYKAEDLQLRRTVALKFLHSSLTPDPGARARFLQEAQSASALDHPNICTIHEASEEAGQFYLAMAHYEGETVKDRIRRGPLPIAEALGIARQVAEGLGKAHRHGIVHRDIKPANLMITGDGVVKILDFGIAKLFGSAELHSVGHLLGSPAYMSPEQVRREDVGFPTDIWSLGVVLFEMVTGARPFRMTGDLKNLQDLDGVFRSLLNEPPPPMSRSRPETPPELDRIVARMLAKAPAERYPTAVEALADLAALQGTLQETPESQEPDRRDRRQAWPRMGVAFIIGALTVVGAILGILGLLDVLGLRRGPSGKGIKANFSQLTYLEGREMFPSLSPDGELLAYAKTLDEDSDIYLQKTRGGSPLNLTESSPADDTMPAFSPDGRQIAFRSERDGGGIYVMSATGQSVRRLTDMGYNPAWSPDGKEIAFATEATVNPSVKNVGSQIWKVNVGTGRRELLLKGDAVQPSWSPSGRRLAYWGVPTGTGKRVIWTVSLQGGIQGGAAGVPAVAVDDGHLNWNPVWSPDGKYLFYSSNRSGSLNLWRIPIDERTGAVRGDPEPMATPAASSGFLSLSRDGKKIVYATDDSRANLERLSFDPVRQTVSGPGAPITKGSRIISTCHLSPDNQWIAFHSVTPREDLFIIRVDGTGMRQLTNDEHRDRRPRWSPDGRRLAFYSNRSGRYEVWTISPDGGNLEQITRTSGPPVFGPTWSPDGRQIVFNMGEDVALINLEDRIIERLPPATNIGNLAWSPSTALLAGETATGIGLYSLASRASDTLVKSGTDPVWLHKSTTLLYVDGARVKSVNYLDKLSRTVTTAPPFSAFNDLTVSTDDNVLYVARQMDEGDIWMAIINP